MGASFTVESSQPTKCRSLFFCQQLPWPSGLPGQRRKELWLRLMFMRKLLQRLGLIGELLAPLTEEELEGILEELDEDGSGSMDFDEFCEMMMTKPEGAE